MPPMFGGYDSPDDEFNEDQGGEGAKQEKEEEVCNTVEQPSQDHPIGRAKEGTPTGETFGACADAGRT